MALRVTGHVTVGGRGRAGAAVSNGEAVVRTGRSGAYALRVDPSRHRFVFVVTPDGARISEGDFFYAVQGWDGRQEGVDFALTSAPERQRRTFSFAQLTDTHVQVTEGRAPAPARMRADVRRALSGWGAAFAVVTGDLTNRGDVPSLEAYRKVMASAPCPVFHLYAGHDGIVEREAPGASEGDPRTRNYESVLGPPYYSFDWGGRHFVIFPNEEAYFALPEREAKARWLAADLKAHRGRETVMFTHGPPTRTFLDGLAKTDVVAVFFGHFHSSKAYAYRGIRVFATQAFPFGGIDTSPRGLRRVSFQGGRMRVVVAPATRRRPPDPPASPEPRPKRRARRPLRLLWSRRLDGAIHRGAPALSGECVMIPLQDESATGRQGVACLGLGSGRVRWRLQTDASIKNAVAVSDGIGVAISVTGRMVAFDVRKGVERWCVDLPGHPDRWIYAAPAIADGVVYAGGKAEYGAYELETGRPIWSVHPDGTRSDAWPCFAGPTVYEDRVVLLVQRRGIVGADRHSGQEVWCRELAVEYMYPKPVVAGGRIVTGGDPGEITALHPASGEALWRRRITGDRHISGLGAEAPDLYAATPDGEVRAYSAAGGRLKWRFEVGRELLDMTPYRRETRAVTGGPTPVGERVAVGAGDGFLYLLDRRSGEAADRWWFGSPVSAAPASMEGRLVVGAFDGLVGCFEVI